MEFRPYIPKMPEGTLVDTVKHNIFIVLFGVALLLGAYTFFRFMGRFEAYMDKRTGKKI